MKDYAPPFLPLGPGASSFSGPPVLRIEAIQPSRGLNDRSCLTAQKVSLNMLLIPKEHDPSWMALFQELRANLSAATGVEERSIEHIGSTAVKGLWAKPIIDIQMGVRDLAAFDLSSVSKAGFSPAIEITKDDPFRDGQGTEFNWEKKYARRDEDGLRMAHLHIRQTGNANHRFALLFRDYLRSDPETCGLYSEFKITAATLAGTYSEQGGTGDYLDLKDPFVKLIACRAEDWATRVGWHVSAW